LYDFILVLFGAVLGANFRFIIYKKLQKYKLINDFRTILINTLASFLLGCFLSFIPKISSLNFFYQLVLFFLIGFLGSLSTFSTYMYELFDSLLKLNFFKALKYVFISVVLGLLALALGLLLGN